VDEPVQQTQVGWITFSFPLSSLPFLSPSLLPSFAFAHSDLIFSLSFLPILTSLAFRAPILRDCASHHTYSRAIVRFFR